MMGCLRRPAPGVWDTGVKCHENEVSRTEGSGERLTFYVLLQLSKVFWANEAVLFGHLSSLPEADHRDSLVVQLLVFVFQRVSLGKDQRTGECQLSVSCASFPCNPLFSPTPTPTPPPRLFLTLPYKACPVSLSLTHL